MAKSQYAVPLKVVKMVQKVQAHILEEPRRFDMNILTEQCPIRWEELDTYQKKTTPPCGTTACIAGWTALLGMPGLRRNKDGTVKLPGGDKVWNFAQKTLGLKKGKEPVYDENLDPLPAEQDGPTTDRQLFYQNEWPQPFRAQYLKEDDKDKPSKKKLAKIAVARLDHFLMTGK